MEELFKIGTRVKLKEEFHGTHARHKKGTIVGYGRKANTVRVLSDGLKHRLTWPQWAWLLDESETEGGLNVTKTNEG